MAKIIKELPISASGATQCLVLHNDAYYVVSSVHASFTGFETLVFAAEKSGKITSFECLAGGKGMSREEAIADLERKF